MGIKKIEDFDNPEIISKYAMHFKKYNINNIVEYENKIKSLIKWFYIFIVKRERKP